MATKLIKLRNKEQDIINKIVNYAADNDGVVEDSDSLSLEITQNEIRQSIDAYANVFKYTLKKEKEYWTDRKKEATQALQRIEQNTDYLKQQLHSLGTDEELIGDDYTILPDTNVSRTIDVDKVESNIGIYVVSMSPEIYAKYFPPKSKEFITVSRKVLLADLPEKHPAIVEEITPTIKIIKTK